MKILFRFILVFAPLVSGLHAQNGGPLYTIGLVRGNNSADGGVADSLNVRCKLRGVLYGNNFRAGNGGIQFSLRDQTGWIGIFRDNTNFGLDLQEGDSVQAIGQVTQFNGLSQLSLDSIRILARNRPLVAPQTVTALNENTESRLIKLEGWQIVNPAGWTGQGSGFTVRVFKGTDTLDLRIDNDCPLYSQPAPSGVLDIIGLGGQFDPSVPRNSGYQILPRRLSDISVQGTTQKAAFFPAQASVTENAGSAEATAVLNIPGTGTVSVLVALKGGSASPGTDFIFSGPQTISFPSGQTTAPVSIQIINNTVAELPETVELVLRPAPGSPAGFIGADSVFTLTIADDDGAGSLIPTYSIATVRGNNSVNGGLPDSLGRYCRLRGVLYGQNLRGTAGGHQFTLRDQTGGIAVISTVTLLATLAEGDSVQVVGRIEHLQGLGALRIDSLRRFSSGNPLKVPTQVSTLNESTESDLIRLLGFRLVNPAEWTTGQGSGGFSVRIFRSTDTLRLRVDSDISLYFDAPPAGVFNVTGLGGQFDFLAPFNSGYEILPRGSSDIQLTEDSPQAAFTNPSQNANEDAGILQVPVKLLTPGSGTAVVQAVVKGGTASSGSDYVFSAGPLISFAPGVTTATLGLTLIDDAVQEPEETIILVLRPQSGVSIGNDSIFTLTITASDQPGAFVPTYSVALIRGSNAIEGGVADSLNVNCKVQGTLYGINLRGINNGIQFALRDATGGIAIFRSSANFGLTSLAEGDSVRAIGKVTQFNGLSQINLDSIAIIATGRPLKPARLVDSLDESTESDLVKVTGFQIVNPTQWATGTGTGFTVQISNGIRTLDMRIDNDCPLFNLPVPAGQIETITGIGGQFDGSIPRTSGYQILPRKESDISLVTASSDREWKQTPFVYPNPASGNWKVHFPGHPDAGITLQLFDGTGRLLFSGRGNPEELNRSMEPAVRQAGPGIYRMRMEWEGGQKTCNLMRY